MTREEILSHIHLGRNKSVCVDISHVPELPSYVRVVEIYRDHQVWVKFYNYGYDEGRIRCRGAFNSLNELIRELEVYLQKPLSEWHNFTKSGKYPEPLEEVSSRLSWDEIQARVVKLFPRSGGFLER